MKNLVFVFSFVFLSLGSIVSSEADDGCCRKGLFRRARRCVVTQPVQICKPRATQKAVSCSPCVTKKVPLCNPCVNTMQITQSYNPCVSTTQYTQFYNPQITATQYTPSYASNHTEASLPNYSSGGTNFMAWGAQSAMNETYTVMKPRETNGSEQEWQEILDQINLYIESQGNMNICQLKSRFAEYGTIINELKLSGDKEEHICYPTKNAWMRRPEVRANIVRVLTNGGVLKPVPEAPAVQETPEAVAVPPEPVTLSGSIETTALGGAASSHADVLEKITSYLAVNNLDICDLKDVIPAYGEVILRLDKAEKFKKNGVLLCYPSIEAWEADTKGAKTEILAVLAENGIL